MYSREQRAGVLVSTIFGALLFVCLVATVTAFVWISDVLDDRKYIVALVAPTPLYAIAPTDYPAANPVTQTLPRDMPLKVLRVRYGKDFEAFKVETPNGTVGWVVGGEAVKVVSRD